MFVCWTEGVDPVTWDSNLFAPISGSTSCKICRCDSLPLPPRWFFCDVRLRVNSTKSACGCSEGRVGFAALGEWD